MVRKICLGFAVAFFFIGCSHDSPNANVITSGTPVKVTTVIKKFMNDTLSLYGTTQFLKKTTITSPISGFIQSVNAAPGEISDAGKILFTIQTKEAASYASNSTDTLFKNSAITIKANHHLQIDSVLKQPGDFVQEGEALCKTADPSSMIVQLNFPFEKNPLVKPGRHCELIFPDGKNSSATVSTVLPEVDAASQTQHAYLRMNSNQVLPENLNVQVKFSDPAKVESFVLPKSAILTDETMNEYWVMKLINDTTAVKQDVVVGRKTKEEVEITDPVFSAEDRILISGNYGLPDTAKVAIIK